MEYTLAYICDKTVKKICYFLDIPTFLCYTCTSRCRTLALECGLNCVCGMEITVKKKWILVFLVLICIAGLAVGLIYLKSVSDYKQLVQEISFEEINLSGIPDGTYIGDCDVNFVYAKVEVVVQNQKIVKITILEHNNGRGEAAEAITDSIIREQKIDVDAVSGATSSSVVIKKAVENALNSN